MGGRLRVSVVRPGGTPVETTVEVGPSATVAELTDLLAAAPPAPPSAADAPLGTPAPPAAGGPPGTRVTPPPPAAGGPAGARSADVAHPAQPAAPSLHLAGMELDPVAPVAAFDLRDGVRLALDEPHQERGWWYPRWGAQWPEITPEVVARGWDAAGEDDPVTLGVTAAGLLRIGLRECGDLVIAGCGGSGVGGLTMSLLASLVMTRDPARLGMVFLGDIATWHTVPALERLPHTVAVVSRDDRRQTERVVRWLEAETERRRRHPDPYRLLVVADEIAHLEKATRERLYRLAGQSPETGVHFLFTTEWVERVKPEDLPPGTGIALRMLSAAHSRAVMGRPDAVSLSGSSPMRGYLAGAGRPRPVEFQGPYFRVPGLPEATVTYADHLEALADLASRAARATGRPAPAASWLPPLPERIGLTDLDGPGPRSADGLAPAPYALDDLPDRGTRATARIDPAAFRHMLVVGGPRSGKSQALVTLAVALAGANSPADVHLFGLNLGGGGLAPLAGLPHCGALVGREEPLRGALLASRLAAEAERRAELLAAGGFADITAQRLAAPAAERLPHLVLLIDGWEEFACYDEWDLSETQSKVLRLLIEGSAVGVHLIVSGKRPMRLMSRMQGLGDLFLLRCSEPGLLDFVATDTDREIAHSLGEQPHGRAVRGSGGRGGTVTQFALTAEPDLSAVVAGAAARPVPHGAPRPFPVEPAPDLIGFTQASSLAAGMPRGPLWTLIGAGDDGQPLGTELGTDPFVVAGPPGSGRSTALLTMIRSLLSRGTMVILSVSDPRSPLRRLVRAPGVAGVLTGDPDPQALRSALGRLDGHGVLLADDVRDPAAFALGGAWGSVLADAAGGNRLGVVVAGTTQALAVPHGRRSPYRAALLLGRPSPGDGAALGPWRLPPAAPASRTTPPGRGLLLPPRGHARTAQVALTTL